MIFSLFETFFFFFVSCIRRIDPQDSTFHGDAVALGTLNGSTTLPREPTASFCILGARVLHFQTAFALAVVHLRFLIPETMSRENCLATRPLRCRTDINQLRCLGLSMSPRGPSGQINGASIHSPPLSPKDGPPDSFLIPLSLPQIHHPLRTVVASIPLQNQRNGFLFYFLCSYTYSEKSPKKKGRL